MSPLFANVFNVFVLCVFVAGGRFAERVHAKRRATFATQTAGSAPDKDRKRLVAGRPVTHRADVPMVFARSQQSGGECVVDESDSEQR